MKQKNLKNVKIELRKIAQKMAIPSSVKTACVGFNRFNGGVTVIFTINGKKLVINETSNGAIVLYDNAGYPHKIHSIQQLRNVMPLTLFWKLQHDSMFIDF